MSTPEAWAMAVEELDAIEVGHGLVPLPIPSPFPGDMGNVALARRRRSVEVARLHSEMSQSIVAIQHWVRSVAP